ncbi:hypothetical protein L9F63_012534, partial [Diploptera punctata]
NLKLYEHCSIGNTLSSSSAVFTTVNFFSFLPEFLFKLPSGVILNESFPKLLSVVFLKNFVIKLVLCLKKRRSTVEFSPFTIIFQTAIYVDLMNFEIKLYPNTILLSQKSVHAIIIVEIRKLPDETSIMFSTSLYT